MQTKTVELHIQDWRLADGHGDELTPADRQPWTATVRIRPDRFDITATAPDGRNREIWIEIDRGRLVAHCYDPDHDEPLTVRIGASSISVHDDRGRSANPHDAAPTIERPPTADEES